MGGNYIQSLTFTSNFPQGQKIGRKKNCRLNMAKHIEKSHKLRKLPKIYKRIST